MAAHVADKDGSSSFWEWISEQKNALKCSLYCGAVVGHRQEAAISRNRMCIKISTLIPSRNLRHMQSYNTQHDLSDVISSSTTLLESLIFLKEK